VDQASRLLYLKQAVNDPTDPDEGEVTEFLKLDKTVGTSRALLKLDDDIGSTRTLIELREDSWVDARSD
jgi:hypothetical protein